MMTTHQKFGKWIWIWSGLLHNLKAHHIGAIYELAGAKEDLLRQKSADSGGNSECLVKGVQICGGFVQI